ncbi:AAA family ATPase [Neptunicella sp. SCSIO 80796]|uniref:AAA family ATPase n=1 Tax=Neptunicella plasticusilytica TaxID=3117012 RepID=UPI003A4DAF5F
MKAAIAKTKNVMMAFDAYQSCVEACDAGSPALAMFTGEAGLGKTTAGGFLFSQADGVLVRCLRSDTLGTFLERLAQDLGLDRRQRRADMLNFIVHELVLQNKPVFIDEADYIADRTDVLETIRDIYDIANVPIILIGYAALPRKVKRLPQLFSRIAQHVEFQPADSEDIRIMASALVTECQIDIDLLEELLATSKGSFRRIHTGLDNIEKFARSNGIKQVSAAHWGEQSFFPVVR